MKTQLSLDRLAVSTSEFARLFGISERHVEKLDETGLLGPRPIVLGRAKRWPLDEVRAWLAAGAPPREQWVRLHSPGQPPIAESAS